MRLCSNQAGNLRRHLNTHSDEKSKTCDLCDFASIQADNFRFDTFIALQDIEINQLFVLVQSHANIFDACQLVLEIQFEEPFENAQYKKINNCDQCNFTSIQADNLRRHLKTHRGENCCICDLEFRSMTHKG